MVKVTDATKIINGERKEFKNVIGLEGGDYVKAGGVMGVAKFAFSLGH